MNRLVAIIVLVLLALILGVGFVWPKYQRLQELKMTIKDKQEELESRERYLADLKKISEEIDKSSESLAKIDAALPAEISLPDLYNFFLKATSQNGLILRDLTTSGPSSFSGRINQLTISLSLSSSYPSFKNFLSYLEKSSRFFEIESFSFVSPAGKDSQFNFSLVVRTHAY